MMDTDETPEPRKPVEDGHWIIVDLDDEDIPEVMVCGRCGAKRREGEMRICCM